MSLKTMERVLGYKVMSPILYGSEWTDKERLCSNGDVVLLMNVKNIIKKADK